MGPCDYSDLVASSRLSDEKPESRAPGGETVIIGCIMSCVSFPIIIFMGLWVCANSLEVGIYGFIGLSLWASARYGTNNSLVARFRYRTTKRERLIIARRLSESL